MTTAPIPLHLQIIMTTLTISAPVMITLNLPPTPPSQNTTPAVPLRLPHDLTQIQQLIRHLPLRRRRDAPLRIRQLLTKAQLHQRLQLLVRPPAVLGALDNLLGSPLKHLIVPPRPPQVH